MSADSFTRRIYFIFIRPPRLTAGLVLTRIVYNDPAKRIFHIHGFRLNGFEYFISCTAVKLLIICSYARSKTQKKKKNQTVKSRQDKKNILRILRALKFFPRINAFRLTITANAQKTADDRPRDTQRFFSFF